MQTTHMATPVLEVAHLEKVYGALGNVTRALNDVSFTVNRGEFVGIMGASGSGKSTLLNCVSTIDSATSGTIRINGENGVYGTTRTHFSGQLREIAFAQEVVTGPAEIWATIEGETPRAYRIQIERVSDADPRRNLVIRVTDPSLLSATGGIVQGMSGSPILQNGRLVGAVTHVLVNDPTRGYGIFAQTMLEQAKNAVQNGAEAQTTE